MGRARSVASSVVVAVISIAAYGCTSQDIAVTIFGDGEISCPNHIADDDSLPVGTVEYQPGAGEIKVTVVLTGAAPDWQYNPVEVWSDESCDVGPLGRSDARFMTDGNGAAEVEFVVSVFEPGTYMINVNISSAERVPDDPRHREMGTAIFTKVVVTEGSGA